MIRRRRPVFKFSSFQVWRRWKRQCSDTERLRPRWALGIEFKTKYSQSISNSTAMIDLASPKERTAGGLPAPDNAPAARATTSHIVIETNLPPSYNEQSQAEDEWSQVLRDLGTQRQQLTDARWRRDEAAISLAERQVAESMSRLNAMTSTNRPHNSNMEIMPSGNQVMVQLEPETKVRSSFSLKSMAKIVRGSPSESAIGTFFRGILLVACSPFIIAGVIFHGVGLFFVGCGKVIIFLGDAITLWRFRSES